MSDIKYEPTRDHWTPYAPWMRDVLSDDARMSWAHGPGESRNTWDIYRRRTTPWAVGVDLRVHPDDVPERPTEEPPVGSQVTDGMGDVWERREGGWALWWAERSGWLADLYGSGLDPWPTVRAQAPLRPTTDEDRKRVGLPTVNTPEGTAPGDTAPADEDPDEALAVVINELVDDHGSTSEWADNEYITRSTALAIARVARECIEQEIPEELDKIGITWQSRARRMGKRAEKAEAEVERLTRQRDEWQARHEALWVDVEKMQRDFDRGLWPDFKGVLARDDAHERTDPAP